MKKILMFLAVIALLMGVSGQAMATSSYFKDGHLIRVVYQAGGLKEVVTDLGAFGATDGSSAMDLSFKNHPFPAAGSATFPGAWDSLQVAYFVKTANGVWISGQSGGQMSGARKYSSFVTAVSDICAAAIDKSPSGAQATLLQSIDQSYESMMNNGDPTINGFFAGFAPNMDGEANLGSIADNGEPVETTLYYYANPNAAAAGTQVAVINTNSDGTTDVSIGSPAVNHFEIVMPASATAGASVTAMVIAVDADGYMIPTGGATGDVLSFTSSDTLAKLPNPPVPPATSPLPVLIKNGVATVRVTFYKAGLQSLTVTDTADMTMTGADQIIIKPAAAKKFAVSAPYVATGHAVTTGQQFNFTVTVQDTYGNTVTGYAKNVHFTTNSLAVTIPVAETAVLPADSKLTKGVGTFQATFVSGGMPGLETVPTITATEIVGGVLTTVKGSSLAIRTVWAPATKLAFTALPAAGTVHPATSFGVTVSAMDANNFFTKNYAGTITLTPAVITGGGTATMPAAAVIPSGTGTGYKAFTGVKLSTAGTIKLTATGTAGTTVAPATSAVITVAP